LPEGGFGIYLHWPFCQAKCPYCDFNSHVWSSVDQEAFAAAFVSEIDRVAALTSDRLLNSIFFGGGTPSLMDVRTIETILERIRSHWRFANNIEITLEANPTSVEAARFVGYRNAGVNRVSIGVQALIDEDLRRLGRLHSVEEALNAVDVARTTFDRVSFDLIYARQDQSVASWERELKRALSFDPEHLSLYQLTIEEGTAFGDRFAKGGLHGLPDEDLAADLWDVTQAICVSRGLHAYETSNHAYRGQESLHNLIYWQSGDWAGIGPGAHGRLTLNGQRFETVSAKSPAAWLERVSAIGSGDKAFASMSDGAILEEQLMMGLRMTKGIDMPDGWIYDNSLKIKELKEDGLIQEDGMRLRLTERGRPLLNAILSQLLVT